MAAPLVVGCSAKRAPARCIAGSPARRRGNFLLRRQKKVTKEEALNRTRPARSQSAQNDLQPLHANTRPAALSLLSLSPASSGATAGRLTRGCTPGSRENQIQRRSGDAINAQHPRQRRPSDAVFPGEPGVQPALTGMKGGWMALVTGTAARAQRLACWRHASGRFRAPLVAASGGDAVQGLFFGDFLLAPQKKVTPPPGGTPGNAASRRALRQSIQGAAQPRAGPGAKDQAPPHPGSWLACRTHSENRASSTGSSSWMWR